jgi:hypothetical protein
MHSTININKNKNSYHFNFDMCKVNITIELFDMCFILIFFTMVCLLWYVYLVLDGFINPSLCFSLLFSFVDSDSFFSYTVKFM